LTLITSELPPSGELREESTAPTLAIISTGKALHVKKLRALSALSIDMKPVVKSTQKTKAMSTRKAVVAEAEYELQAALELSR
jgi:hypothetical protein